MRQALEQHDRIVSQSITEHWGTTFSKGGDSFCAAFESPTDALAAALDSQSALAQKKWNTRKPVKVRMGIHTGLAQQRDDDYYGPTLNRASRLMSVGHGGQILVSASARSLLVDQLPPGVDLKPLGVHHLKDLDRPEEIFQVSAAWLRKDFPPLRSESNGATNVDVEVSRAYESKRWEDVVTLLSDSSSHLTGKQLEMLGFAHWWLGEHEKVIQDFERAYGAFVAEGRPEDAAVSALELAELHAHNLSPDISNGWVSRAERLLDGLQTSVATGYLQRWKAVKAFEHDNDLDRALSLADEVAAIGKVTSDGNLEVLALQDKGRFLVATGQVDEGMPLMDEAMTAAVAGDVNPGTVGRSYCNMLAVCDQTGDIRRAAEWSEAAERWCEENESSPYPGICRIFKAEITWLNGDWVKAETEVKRASGELGLYTDISGEAWYQYGLMRLRAGDYETAEAAFQEALTRGREPLPGYAFVLHHRGETESAIDMLTRSLDDSTLTKLDRAPFLPVLIELSLEADDSTTPLQAVEELEEISRLARSDYYSAQAEHARGRIAAREDAKTGIEHLKKAAKGFSSLRLPYEAARVRTDLAKAYLLDGATALATLELKSARATFERLGAAGDLAEVESLLP